MSYATKQDMIDRCDAGELQQITDRATPPAGSIDDNVLGKALGDAEAEVNGYIAVRVTTPVAAPVPASLTQAVCAIARYRLWKNRASERVRTDYEDAIAWCRDVAAGKVALGSSGDTATPPPSGGAPQVVAPERRFSDRQMRSY